MISAFIAGSLRPFPRSIFNRVERPVAWMLCHIYRMGVMGCSSLIEAASLGNGSRGKHAQKAACNIFHVRPVSKNDMAAIAKVDLN